MQITQLNTKDFQGNRLKPNSVVMSVTHRNEGLLAALYLSQLHELPNLCHPGQEPLVDLQGLLTVALLHLEVFLYNVMI